MTDAAPSSPCKNCGAPLEGVRYALEATCKHCGTKSENPMVLAAGDEVMSARGETYELGTVQACRGPKAIDVEFDGKPRTNLVFLDLVPVLRATNELRRGTAVFHRDTMGWIKTWTGTDAAHGSIKTKHENSSFQDPFFDKQASLTDIRVPAVASAAAKRSLVDDWMERFKSDPFGAIVKLIIYSVWFVMGAAFLAVIIAIVVGMIRSR